MNKLLQTTLISAILASGAMAGGETELPATIEEGAIAYVNKNITINSTIDNYGTITTEATSDPYPTITNYGTINNHTGISLNEITDTSEIMENNPVDGVTKIYDIHNSGGTIDERLTISGKPANTIVAGEVDFASLTENDMVYLASTAENQTLTVKGKSVGETDIKCNFGDIGADDSYGLIFENAPILNLTGNLSNYKNGHIEIDSSCTNFWFNGQELYVPIHDECYTNIRNVNLYSTYDAIGFTHFSGTSTLKKGAVLRIGAAPVSTGNGE